ncbi:uncharacterized protein LOC129592553 isoform X1 [Paramacrobiotus metropolitanus]|uniref:uncharacterized protein LOC129592553 isoform X1 n=1 Tax=Paramacrobiotus metropolitanus TaxID=2943436 RepID=UPI002446005A|nr:uncharacterized protein LOC129592553 isoform X1 [Paramacrobiotus metropolitanus]
MEQLWSIAIVFSLGTLTATASSAATISCYHCDNHAGMACGLGAGWNVSDLESTAKPCPDGFCYTNEYTENDRSVPKVWRGCGPVSCKNIPGAADSIGVCDDSDKLAPLDPDQGDPFDHIRSFSSRHRSTGHMQAGTVQYCKTGNECNYQSVRNFPLAKRHPDRSPTVQEVMDQLQSPKVATAQNPAAAGSRVKQLFRMMDTNGDGVLGEAEFVKSRVGCPDS